MKESSSRSKFAAMGVIDVLIRLVPKWAAVPKRSNLV